MSEIPVIDISALLVDEKQREQKEVAQKLLNACTSVGFFYVTGCGVDTEETLSELFSLTGEFFALPLEEKSRIHLRRSGVQFRGYSELNSEQTLGQPDYHECLDFGVQDLPLSDPRVKAGKPLHGPNQWPERPAGLKGAVVRYMAQMTRVGQAIMTALLVDGLGVDRALVEREIFAEPFSLLRLLHYPPATEEKIGIGPHSDYGCLTLLAANAPGLEIQVDGVQWISVPLRPGAFIVNLGDSLASWTGGRVKATKHRVGTVKRDRISIPFFFEPSFDCPMAPLLDRGEKKTPANEGKGGKGHKVYGEYLFERYAYSYAKSE